LDANLQSTGHCSQPPPLHNRSFPNPFQFIIRHLIIRRYIISLNTEASGRLIEKEDSEGMENVAKKPEEKEEIWKDRN
jgi:hypothetical protein